MHRSQIFRTLIIATVITCGGNLESVAAQASKTDVFAEFKKKTARLEADISKEKDAQKRYELFLKNYKELGELRAKNPRQAEEKELNMSLYMDTLSYLPTAKDFNVKKCPDYKKEIDSMMKSYDKTQKEPFIEMAQKLITAICK